MTTSTNSVSSHRPWLVTALGLGVIVFGSTLADTTADAGGNGRPQHEFDVACDGATFRLDGPVDTNGMPANGAHFVVEGLIYPKGTFDTYGPNAGFNADGTPQFPNKIVGRWSCRGWFINDGFTTATGNYVITSQTYDFDLSDPGSTMMTSDGYERIDLGVPYYRAITGGTGQYKRERGEVEELARGFNATGFFNLTFDFGRRRGPLPTP